MPRGGINTKSRFMSIDRQRLNLVQNFKGELVSRSSWDQFYAAAMRMCSVRLLSLRNCTLVQRSLLAARDVFVNKQKELDELDEHLNLAFARVKQRNAERRKQYRENGEYIRKTQPIPAAPATEPAPKPAAHDVLDGIDDLLAQFEVKKNEPTT
jgi:hypothetical protein